MARKITASDRSALIKMASKMPVGSPERKAVLAGLSKKEARLSADVMRNWRSKDTPAEQKAVLGEAMAESYEVIQTILMLAKKTEGVDSQPIYRTLQSLGAAISDL